jgi:hypothetical protein
MRRVPRPGVFNRVATPSFAALGLACLFVLIATSPSIAQAGVQVSAEIDRETLSADEQVTLTISVSGSFDQINDPELPSLSGFRVVGSSRSSQFSMADGVVTSRMLFAYRLQPIRPGIHVIPPVTVQANGAIYQTESISIEVTSGTLASPMPAPVATESAPSRVPDLFVEASVDNIKPFLGQQITYHFRFYQATTVFGQPELQWPVFSGFWTEALTPERVYQAAYDGRDYRVTEIRQALFPTVAGHLGIEPTTLRIPGSLYDQDQLLMSEPITVEAHSLPEHAPAGFDGAVGQYHISATLAPPTVGTDEPTTLRVRLWGTGNISALSDPTEGLVQELSDWRVYQSQIMTNVDQEGSAIEGEKLFERLMIPELAGDLVIPAISFVFFDPQDAVYQQIQTEPFTIRVTSGEALSPSVAQPDDGSEDIRPIKPPPAALAPQRSSILQQPVYWLGWALPLAGLVGVWSWQRRHERRGDNPARARTQRAYSVARRRLREAHRQAAYHQDSSYATVAQALTGFVGDKLNISTSGLTREAMREQLAGRGVADSHIDGFLGCLEWADSGRFAPVAAGKGPEALVADAEQAIQQLERALNDCEPNGPLDRG